MTPTDIPGPPGPAHPARFNTIPDLCPLGTSTKRRRGPTTGPDRRRRDNARRSSRRVPVGGSDQANTRRVASTVALSIAANTNLAVSFLELVKDAGFTVVLRPGPFISDEWANGGLPYHVAPSSRETPRCSSGGPHGSALGPGFPFSPPLSTVTGGSTLFYFSSPSYAVPAEYLTETQVWLAEFSRFLRDGGRQAQHPRGTRWRPCRSTTRSCFFYRFGAFEVDYSPATCCGPVGRKVFRAVSRRRRRGRRCRSGITTLHRPAFKWQRQFSRKNGSGGDLSRRFWRGGPGGRRHRCAHQPRTRAAHVSTHRLGLRGSTGDPQR